MRLGPLCMQLRAPISLFLLFGANSSPEKSAVLLSIAKFDKNSAKWNVFWCRNGIWGAFVLGPLHQNQHFFEGPTPPLSKLKFPPYRKNRTLSTQ